MVGATQHTDPTCADHADRATVQIEAQQSVQGKIIGACTRIGAVDRAHQAHNEAHRKLGDSLRRIGGYVRHRYPEPGGDAQIHVVRFRQRATRRAACHRPPVTQNGRIEHVVDKATHGGEPGREQGSLRCEAGLLENQLVTGTAGVALREGAAVILNPAVGFELLDGFAAVYNQCGQLTPGQGAAAGVVGGLSGNVAALR